MTGQAIRVHMARDVTRSRRFRLGASAIVAGIAVGAFVSATPGAEPAPAPATPPGSVGPGHRRADQPAGGAVGDHAEPLSPARVLT